VLRYRNIEAEDPTVQHSIRSATDLGAAIQDARREAGLTQADLAERAGVSRPYLAQVERGRSSRLLELVLDLLRVLDLELIVRRRTSPRG
jgi:HTH-type transcriptional regulator / antitoxin HipB